MWIKTAKKTHTLLQTLFILALVYYYNGARMERIAVSMAILTALLSSVLLGACEREALMQQV